MADNGLKRRLRKWIRPSSEKHIYYIGPGGSDANDGLSWAQRKLTLKGVEEIPVAFGDTVYVGPRTYREPLTSKAMSRKLHLRILWFRFKDWLKSKHP